MFRHAGKAASAAAKAFSASSFVEGGVGAYFGGEVGGVLGLEGFSVGGGVHSPLIRFLNSSVILEKVEPVSGLGVSRISYGGKKAQAKRPTLHSLLEGDGFAF